MVIARNLHLRNLSAESVSSVSNAVRSDANAESLEHIEANPVRSPLAMQRFPSSTISNETFMWIDEWPKQQPPEISSPTCSFLARQRDWIRVHWLLSSIASFVALLLLLAIALAIILPLTLSNSKSSPASISDPAVTVPANESSSSSQTSTTTEPFRPGYWADVNMQLFALNDTTGLQSMRPDARSPGDYILTAADRIILLSSCTKRMTNLALWDITNVDHCSNDNVTIIDYQLKWRLCSKCDVFDILDGCRQNSTLCSDFSFAVCCRNCSSDSPANICSLRGSSFADYESIFLDGRFIYHNISSYSLLFSTLSYDHRNLCLLQQQLMRYRGDQITVANLPSRTCSSKIIGMEQLQSAAITTITKLQNTWKALLTDSAIIYLSNLNGTTHVIGDVVNKNAKLFMQPDGNNSALLVDISMETGTFSAIRIVNGTLEILVPRHTSISIPGSFMDAFLDNGELVIWTVFGNAVFVARVRFSWS